MWISLPIFSDALLPSSWKNSLLHYSSVHFQQVCHIHRLLFINALLFYGDDRILFNKLPTKIQSISWPGPFKCWAETYSYMGAWKLERPPLAGLGVLDAGCPEGSGMGDQSIQQKVIWTYGTSIIVIWYNRRVNLLNLKRGYDATSSLQPWEQRFRLVSRNW